MAAAAAAAASLKQTRMTILLSLNAVAIIIAGILIASALGLFGDGADVVSEYSDDLDGKVESAELIGCGEGDKKDGSCTEEVKAPEVTDDSSGGTRVVINQAAPNSVTASGESTDDSGKATGGNVPSGELWNETSMTVFQSADKDLCIDNSLPGYDKMYWQTSNKSVINGFYSKARFGNSDKKCRYPSIVGTGTTKIIAGTYDGSRRDEITVTVVAVPVEQWKHEVLDLVNKERKKAGKGNLQWGNTCAQAAMTRATEIITKYDHTRPNGKSWTTACPVPKTGGGSGENLAAGANVPSPSKVVAAWMASPAHKKNILGSFKYLSVGLKFDPSKQYKIYWSQIFSTY